MGDAPSIPALRALSTIMNRVRALSAGMFGGKRDFYSALGYKDAVSTENFRFRYDRGDIAGRIVDAYPKAT